MSFPTVPAAYSIVYYPRHDDAPGLTFAYVMFAGPDGSIRTDQDGVLDAGKYTPATLASTFVRRAVQQRARRLADAYMTRCERHQLLGLPRWSLLRFPIHLRAQRHATRPYAPTRRAQATVGAPAGLRLTDTTWEYTCESEAQKVELLAAASKLGIPVSKNPMERKALGLGWNDYSNKLYAYPATVNGLDGAFTAISTAQLLALFAAYVPEPVLAGAPTLT